MKKPALTIPKLSLNNLRRRPFRTVCLSLVVGILAFTLFAGSLLTISLNNGMSSVEQRLGADLMVVPGGHEAEVESVLLKGEPNYFYFNGSVEGQIAQVKGVSQVSSQFYLASLSEACCTWPVQLIGFDPNTDFVIQPWIAKTYGKAVGDEQLIAGSEITLESNHTLKFFGHSYPVAAQLDKTATGLDSSVFMNKETMEFLLAGAQEEGMNFMSDQEPDGAISSVLVKIESGYDADEVAYNIRSSIPNVDVVVSKNLITGISNQLNAFVVYIYLISAVIWVLAAIVLAVVFSVTINERKKEFAVLRVLGATRKKLMGIVLTESLLTSLAGGIVGTAAASLIVLPFSTYIGDRLQLSYLQPQPGVILGVLALSLLLSLTVGPIASIYSAVKISKAETYLTMREGE